MSSKEKVKIKLRRPIVKEQNEWVVQNSKTREPGRPYYLNVKTGETRWTPPRECGKEDENNSNRDKDKDHRKIGDQQQASPKIPADRSPIPMPMKVQEASIDSIAQSDQVSRSVPTKRKPATFVRDLFNVSADEASYRPEKKRLRRDGGSEQLNPAAPAFPPKKLPVSFSFKIPPGSFGQFPVMDVNSMPMDTSASYTEDERMSPVPVQITTEDDDPVESMEVDEFVEEIILMRKDNQEKFPEAAPMNDLVTDWETVLSEMVMWNMVVIVDTNILLSGLSFLRDLEARSQNGLLRIVVPYTVIRELDVLKTDRTSVFKRNEHNALAESARAAIAWISDQLAKGPRSSVIFQPGYADRNGLPGFEVNCSDDRILKCALEISNVRRDAKSLTVMCSNDKNLLNKAKINCQACATKKELESYLRRLHETSTAALYVPAVETLSKSTEDALMAVAMPTTADRSEVFGNPANAQICIQAPPPPPPRSEKLSETEEILDSCRRVLTTVAENETKSAFGALWSDVLKVKPPWHTLADVLNVMIQHWVAVFRFAFTKESKELLDELYKDARHAVTFGYGQIGRSILRRLLLLFSGMCRKDDNRALINQISGRIQQCLSSTSGE